MFVRLYTMLETACRTLSQPIIVDQIYYQIARLRSIDTIIYSGEFG